jgi:hypothetical protein
MVSWWMATRWSLSVRRQGHAIWDQRGTAQVSRVSTARERMKNTFLGSRARRVRQKLSSVIRYPEAIWRMVERGGPDGGVRGDGEAAKEERPGVGQRLRELGLVEDERVDAVEEGEDPGAEVTGGSGKRGGGADREAVDDGAQDIIVEVGEAIGAHGGRACARAAAAAGPSHAGPFAGRGARHRSWRGEGLVRWGEWIWFRDCCV